LFLLQIISERSYTFIIQHSITPAEFVTQEI